jgi:hypothetical protein
LEGPLETLLNCEAAFFPPTLSGASPWLVREDVVLPNVTCGLIERANLLAAFTTSPMTRNWLLLLLGASPPSDGMILDDPSRGRTPSLTTQDKAMNKLVEAQQARSGQATTTLRCERTCSESDHDDLVLAGTKRKVVAYDSCSYLR